ncbi:hypothetical protein GS535_03600 [Saccharibacter sp. EH611]|uniref:hypothetical protein n=1 Tax=unclassified Saccharibacter TaxID=2648722 RepID=UPI00132B1CAC|nr:MULTISPECIES: hypothetical protein [unclassified Saccharibacter]MXV35642.1 hypothetical protein [Saccharibacter sp. EH611]MXV65746.1 hypothetical protein [Saccharibacter sp. EH60]
MADDTNPSKSEEATQPHTDQDTLHTTSRTPPVPNQDTFPTVRAVALRPIYDEPGHPPIPPGTDITICTTTAREWVEVGIIRLASGEVLPAQERATEGAFPIFAKSAPPPPTSQG